MLALIYLVLAICLGDALCQQFYRFVSVPHRVAAAVLVGLLVSSWFTYLAGLAFMHAPLPLIWGNLLFFVASIAAVSWFARKNEKASAHGRTASCYLPRSKGSDWADWVLIAGYIILVSWMMFASFNTTGSKLQISNPEYSDFGPNTAIMQSFAVGHNFPTEYPHFSGDRIRYHFLFYFQAGNLEFLGLDPAWSLNLLSIITLVAMLMLVMALGEALFESRAVGRVGSALFFFFGSLSYIPFLHKQGSVRGAIQSILHLREFLPTIFPYRGEAWGTWSQVTFLNQRHFASAIGILLLVLIFLVIRYRAFYAERAATAPPGKTLTPEAEALPQGAPETLSDNATSPESLPASTSAATATPVLEPRQPGFFNAQILRSTVPGFVFSGVLLGLLPMWNSAAFIAAFVILAVLFVLCPFRVQMVALAITAGLIALPQMLYLSTGSGRAQMPKLLHWGYTLDHPTALNVTKYLGFTFGFKWLLIALALLFASSLQRRVFVAVSSLLVVAFSCQFTIEALANQKFFHIWVAIVNLFVAFALWRLWRSSLAGTTLPGKLAAILLFVLIIPGGLIEFLPIHNTYWSEVAYKNDPLVEWLMKETKPREIFLTDRFVSHPILMAGRRVFYGWPYYSWGAGYDSTKRDRAYLDLFQTKDPRKVFRLLKDNNISYVAFDNAVRRNEFVKSPNEQVFATYFPKVFQDKEHRYNSLTIYKVPETAPSVFRSLPEVGTSMFEGGKGLEKGQFDVPRGMTVDRSGNILVADTNNGRIQKFSPSGMFLGVIGTKGEGLGEFREPCGVAVDSSGNIYVADTANQRVQKLKPDGTFIAEWKGPEPGFYGPRDISIGADNSIYVVDEGHARIVKLDTNGNVLAVWGERGTGDGQFNDPTSVAVDTNNDRLYVADPLNRRIEVFDTNGHFVANWFVREWRPIQNAWYMQDLAIDYKAGRLYATSTQTDEVLVFDLTGKQIASLRPRPPDKLEGASALVLVGRKLYVLCTFGNRVSQVDLLGK
ncbi:MAG TPA: NHL repeat-containing protein [Candidatus Udaeobacter sp.]|nr:NHL repeat-containing protein [Candidatus Udaeobacter sp.]